MPLVEIELTKAPPATANVGVTYTIEGNVKFMDVIGAPPWVYAEVQKKDWYKPEIIEETTYERGIPAPITGNFSITWKPTKTGIFEVTVVATPAPIALPVIGVPPVVGSSDMMKVTVGEIGIDVSEFKITAYNKVTV